ncbi:uncharacterized protein EAE97_001999 [Botrytis byssoidea]|uniref:Uncharacterized protein n=1 Tax=Botrytis byssoidea TaxID=139641 RepID=A0A9P5M380_9HELO|nr:uncharacterized protein EAE97_001999 [Botrytis byssoidea]KAF7952502.1 hypothetical protein EAE97_001999 [Botrytis byssoidea]
MSSHKDWSMFNMGWSFQIGSTRANIEPIDPLQTTPESQLNVSNQISQNRGKQISRGQTNKVRATLHPHSAIKLFGQMLIVNVNFHPENGQESTHVPTLMKVLPEYGTFTRFIHIRFHDELSDIDTAEGYQRREAIQSIISMLNSFQNIKRFTAVRTGRQA